MKQGKDIIGGLYKAVRQYKYKGQDKGCRILHFIYNPVMSLDPGLPRCQWPGKIESNSLMVEYHDTEWGVPVHDDRKHFEYLVLDAFQAGLSWSTVLNKRDNFREAFDNFEPERIARYTRRNIDTLLGNPGIIRNRLKIESTISNARMFMDLQEQEGTFDAFVWRFVDGRTRHNRWRSLKQLPARTDQSDTMSKALKARGFKFVGSTICYAYMQAAGLVNDHVTRCFRHEQIRNMQL